jgi:CheY-like chemotaxis protein
MPSVLLLLVEDEHAVAVLLNTALTDAGYEVITARNGHDAVKEIEADAARFRAMSPTFIWGPDPRDGKLRAARANSSQQCPSST